MTLLKSRLRHPATAREKNGVPPLEPGDHLTRDTFHARYEAMPPGVKAELIGGIVYMPSPTRRAHGRHPRAPAAVS